MKLVVDIPEDYYNVIKEIPVEQSTADMLIIRYGTPLPKGHGRLIDADALGEKLHGYTEAPYQYVLTVFNESPTIIDADGGDAV